MTYTGPADALIAEVVEVIVSAGSHERELIATVEKYSCYLERKVSDHCEADYENGLTCMLFDIARSIASNNQTSQRCLQKQNLPRFANKQPIKNW